MMQRPALVTAMVFLLLLACREEPCSPSGARFHREEALRHDLLTMRKAIDDYHDDKKRFPESVDELVRSHYLRTVPSDPITGTAASWIVLRKGGLVVDIRSGADGVGCDGTPYRSW